MSLRLRRGFLRTLSYIMPDWLSRRLAQRVGKALQIQLREEITEEFLELLLNGMGLCFTLSRRFRRNLQGFTGRYVFRTRDRQVMVSAVFGGGGMQVSDSEIADWDTRVTFRNTAALWAMLLQSGDVLEAILADDVEIDGNLNYVYKFGFMASDLTRILGIA